MVVSQTIRLFLQCKYKLIQSQIKCIVSGTRNVGDVIVAIRKRARQSCIQSTFLFQNLFGSYFQAYKKYQNIIFNHHGSGQMLSIQMLPYECDCYTLCLMDRTSYKQRRTRKNEKMTIRLIKGNNQSVVKRRKTVEDLRRFRPVISRTMRLINFQKKRGHKMDWC